MSDDQAAAEYDAFTMVWRGPPRKWIGRPVALLARVSHWAADVLYSTACRLDEWAHPRIEVEGSHTRMTETYEPETGMTIFTLHGTFTAGEQQEEEET